MKAAGSCNPCYKTHCQPGHGEVLGMVRLVMEGMKGSGMMLNGLELRRGNNVEED